MNEIFQAILEPIGIVLIIGVSMLIIDVIYYAIVQLHNSQTGRPIQSYKEFNDEIVKHLEKNDAELD